MNVILIDSSSLRSGDSQGIHSLTPGRMWEQSRVESFHCQFHLFTCTQIINKRYKVVRTHLVTLTQVGTSVYLGQTHLGTSCKFLLGSESFHLGQLGMTISFGMSLVSKVTSLNEELCRKEHH